MSEAVWGIDTIDANEPAVPLGAPVIWAYVTGTTQRPEIEWEPSDIARFPHSQVYRIDQGFGSRGPFDADEFDLEAGAWTVDGVAGMIAQRNRIRWSTRVYCGQQNRADLLAALAARRIDARSVFFRIADWRLNEAEARRRLTGDIYAWQWASPSSNPATVIPGTRETLARVNADLSVIRLGSTQWQG